MRQFVALFLPTSGQIEKSQAERSAFIFCVALFLRYRYDPHDITRDFLLDFVSWFYAELRRQDLGQGHLQLARDFTHFLTLSRNQSLSSMSTVTTHEHEHDSRPR